MKINKYLYVCDASNNGADLLDRLITIRPIVVVSVKDMIDKILQRIGDNPIKNLYIAGHGSPGNQSVGCGVNKDPTGERSIAVNWETGYLKGANTYHELQRLCGKFTPDAIVTLGGCQVGAGDIGEQFLIHLSRIWGVPVQAGTENQRVKIPGMEGPIARCDGKTGTCVSLPRTFWGSPGGGIN